MAARGQAEQYISTTAHAARAPSHRDDFDRLVAEAYAKGHDCHGELGLQAEDFTARLLAVARKYLGPEAPAVAVNSAIRKLHVEDLFLATACARNTEAGWHRFSALYRKCLNDLFRFMTHTADAALELADHTLIDMFLPDRSGNSRIASYDGRSSLTTWLRVIVTNRAINERQRMHNRMQRVEPTVEIADGGALFSVEARLHAGRYEQALNDSLQSACRQLDTRERLVLLWRYEESLQLGEIARLLNIHQSTVTRQLERLLKRLREEVTSLLASKHRLSPAAIEECLSLIDDSRSRSISILAYVRQEPAPEVHGPPARISEREQRGVALRRACLPSKRANA